MKIRNLAGPLITVGALMAGVKYINSQGGFESRSNEKQATEVTLGITATTATIHTVPVQTLAPIPNKDQFPVSEVFLMQVNVPAYPVNNHPPQQPHTKTITYAWPVGRPHKSLMYTNAADTLPCVPEQCHWDGTYAVDIAYSDAGRNNPMRPLHADGEDAIAGEPVRAFVGGHIDYAKTYRNIPGCNQIKLHGEDGYYYWYGHLGPLAAIPADGVVTAGQLLASAGSWKCDADSQSPQSYTHVHIDQGCVDPKKGPQPGGNDPCRNRLFVEIMNQMYAALPE